jgi:hypothetical protein
MEAGLMRVGLMRFEKNWRLQIANNERDKT